MIPAKMDPDELRMARHRLARAQFITDEYELNRLRVRFDHLPTAALRSDCLKAIGRLALKKFITA